MIDVITTAFSTINRQEIPLRVVAELTGYPLSEIWAYFQDKKVCPRERAIAIGESVRMLDAFANSIAPIPISWKSPKIRSLVDRFRAGELKITVVDGCEVLEGSYTVGDVADL
jgi:hypothetical protein